jgi:Rad3-related DNA helicase
MDDNAILLHIEDLVNEEHQLSQRSHSGGLSEEEHQRMRQLEVNLDQCWDLLRQRRALRSAHLNPDEARERPPGTVEHYQQ